MSFLRDLYFFQGQKYTSFGKNILLRQSASLGHSSTGHPDIIDIIETIQLIVILYTSLVIL